MRLRLNNNRSQKRMLLIVYSSQRETKNYHGKIYITKLLTYCNF